MRSFGNDSFGMTGRSFGFGAGGGDGARGGVGGLGIDRGDVGKRGGNVERGVVGGFGTGEGGRILGKDRGVVGKRGVISGEGGFDGRRATGVFLSLLDRISFVIEGGSPSGVVRHFCILNKYYLFLILFTVKLCSFINRLVLFFVRSHTLFLK